jgi:precorrin-3B methylase
VVPLADLDPDEVDMSTVLIVGSTTTRMLPGRPPSTSVYTPRTYG